MTLTVSHKTSWHVLCCEKLENRNLLATVTWAFENGLPEDWEEGAQVGCEQAEDGNPFPFPWHVENGKLTGSSEGTEPEFRQCSWVQTPELRFKDPENATIRVDASYQSKQDPNIFQDRIVVELIESGTNIVVTEILDFFQEVVRVPIGFELTDSPQTVEVSAEDAESDVGYRVRFRARDYDNVPSIGRIEFDNLRITSVESLSTLPGDFNGDDLIDEADIMLLCQEIRQPADSDFDLNGDEQIDQLDLTFLIEEILQTSFGDANLDGIFNSNDLIQIFQLGEYEDAITGNSTWGSGDWNCDGDFTTSDLIAAFQNGGYSQNAKTMARVPLSDVPFLAGGQIFAALADDDQHGRGR